MNEYRRRVKTDAEFASARLAVLEQQRAIHARLTQRITPIAMAAEIAVEPNVVELFGEVDEGSAIEFRRRMARCDKSKPLTIRIDSPGGICTEGFAVADDIAAWPSKTTAKIEGGAYSMASFIAIHADERLMRPNSTLMIHAPHNPDADVQMTAGDVELIARFNRMMLAGYAKVLVGGRKKAGELMTGETWLDANEAIALGIATGTC